MVGFLASQPGWNMIEFDEIKLSNQDILVGFV